MIVKDPGAVDYPTSDGRPMAETDTHRQQMVDLIDALSHHFRDRDDVYVSGNLLFYYVEGNKRRHISPDVMVVIGIPKGKRDYYLLWKEGRSPQVVMEITSSSTRHEDMHKKKKLYESQLTDQYGFGSVSPTSSGRSRSGRRGGSHRSSRA